MGPGESRGPRNHASRSLGARARPRAAGQGRRVLVAATQALLAHEAGHVVGGLLVGQHVREVRLGATKRNPRNAATTTFELDGDIDLYGRLVATLMGPMAEGQPPPAWPPLPDLDGHNDEHICAVLVTHLKLSKSATWRRWR